jgi:hypothetical protein
MMTDMKWIDAEMTFLCAFVVSSIRTVVLFTAQ